jgi:DNA repair protein RadC
MLHSDIKKPLTTAGLLELLTKIADERQEHFVVITLDAAGRLINSRVVFIGTVTATLVHPREIFAQAIADYATGIIVSHNHPSGVAEPSREDITTTQRLVAAGQILGIGLEDHIIVAGGEHFSFAANGLILPHESG